MRHGRTEVIVIRVTPQEKEAIRRAANSGWDEPEHGIGESRSLSRYLRVLALKNAQGRSRKPKKGSKP